MTAFDLRANFNAVSPGPMTKAAKLAVWGLPASSIYSNPSPAAISLYDSDSNGQWFSVVAGGVNGGQCCRMLYPAGVAGEGSRFYQIQCGPLGVPVNVEFDFMFETGFDWSQDVGKIAPQIVWGGRSGANGGVETFATWHQNGTAFNPIVQNQQSPTSYPSMFISPVFYTAAIQAGRWYHWRYQFMGGPGGWAKHWLDGQLLSYSLLSPLGNTTPNDPVMYEVGFWSGGTHGPLVDSYARHDNFRIWTDPPQSLITQAQFALT
jgi:hypothetical protein